MRFKFKYMDKIVGLFLFTSVFLMFIAIAFILLNQRIFVKKHYFISEFNEAGDLVNKDIIFKGFTIGKIKSVILNEKNMVDTVFYIYDDYYHVFKEGSVLKKSTNPISGTKIIFVQNNHTNTLYKENSLVPSYDSAYAQYLLQEKQIDKMTDPVTDIIESVQELLASINNDNNASDNSIARILVNTADVIEQLKKELITFDTILNNFLSLSYQMRDSDGLVQRLVDPDGEYMFNSIQSSLISLSEMLEELNQFSSFVGTQKNQIEGLLIESKDTIKETRELVEAIKANPLIKGGVEEKKEQEVVKESVRDKDF